LLGDLNSNDFRERQEDQTMYRYNTVKLRNSILPRIGNFLVQEAKTDQHTKTNSTGTGMFKEIFTFSGNGYRYLL